MRVRALLAVFGLILCCAAAQAQPLLALAHDRVSGTQQLANVDPVAGTVSPVGAGRADCCRIAPGATANDPFAGSLYALASDPTDGLLRLSRWTAVGVGTEVGNTGSAERVLGFGFERASQRLLATLVDPAGAVRIVAVNPTTAALSTVHTGLADLRLEPGVWAMADGTVHGVGRLAGDATSVRRLYSFATNGSNAVSTTDLPASARLPVLVVDPDGSGLYTLLQGTGATPSLQLARVVPGTGLVPIGSATSGCCAVALDVAAVQSGVLRALARDPAAPTAGLSVLSVPLATGAFAFSTAPLPSTWVIVGLHDQLKGLIPSTTAITSITPTPVRAGQPFGVTVSVTSAGSPLTGSIVVGDGLGGTCTIVLPAVSCGLTAGAAGPVTITATYAGNGSTIAGSSASSPLTIQPAAATTTITSVVPSPSIIGQAYAVNVAVAGFNPTGTVTVADGLGATCDIVLPATSCNLGSVSVGPRTLTANYPGDANNLSSSGTRAHTVARAPSATTITAITPSPATVGQPYTVTVTVAGFGVTTGSVVVTDGNGATCTITLPATACPLTSTAAGNRTITASYSGDTNNLPGSATQSLVVQRVASTTTITGVVPATGVVGQAYAVSVSVAGFGTPAGSVVVNDGAGASCTITLPAASCSLVSASAGARTLTASYGGDTNSLPSAGTFSYTVQPGPSTTVLTSSPAPAVVAQPVTLTAAIGAFGNPGGTVAFTDGGNPIAGCAAVAVTSATATCVTSFPVISTRALQASYAGDANTSPSNGTLSLVVAGLATTTVVSATPNPVLVADPITLTATVSGGLTPLVGTVAFQAGGQPIVGCSALPVSAGNLATCSTSLLGAGSTTIVATYSGDADDTASSGSIVVQVGARPVPVLGWPAVFALLLIIGLVGVRRMRA